MITARGRVGLTQEQLAVGARLTQQTVSKIERGLMSPSDATKVAIAVGLGSDVGALFPWPSLGAGLLRPEGVPARWQLDMVLVPTFRCAVSGREGQIALRLSDPLDDSISPVMMDPTLVSGVIRAGLDAIEVGLDMVDRDADDG